MIFAMEVNQSKTNFSWTITLFKSCCQAKTI